MNKSLKTLDTLSTEIFQKQLLEEVKAWRPVLQAFEMLSSIVSGAFVALILFGTTTFFIKLTFAFIKSITPAV